MITIVAIDPGTTESAFVAMSGRKLVRFGKISNQAMLDQLDFERIESDNFTTLVVEMFSSYGMPVGDDVFEACLWAGRFVQRWNGRHELLKRHKVKQHLCGNQRAKDSNIRASLIERYGGKLVAIGNARAKGPLHGVTYDTWSALAIATVYRERAAAEVGSGVILP